MKAVLFCANPYAFGILKPLHDELIGTSHEVIWYLPDNHLGVFPFRDEVMFTTSIQEIYNFKSDAIFVPGNEIPHYLRGVKVQIFHGMAGEKKGHFRIRHYFDLYLTQGPYFTNRFNQLASKYKDFKVIETGWSKLDTLFKGNSDYQDEKRELLNKTSRSHLVLYAPTFSPSLTSAIELKNQIFEQAKNQDIYLMIKFHDLMNRDVMLEYEQMAKSYDNVEVVTERNILKYLVMADIMISDTSSVVYEFVFLNKPVITLNSKSPSIVWLNISQPNELSNALTDTINNDPFAEKRQYLISQYHPYTDGMSSKRMIAAVEDYIAEYGVPQRRKLNLFRRHKMNKDFGPEPK